MKKNNLRITLLEKKKNSKSVKAKSNQQLIAYNRILGKLQKGWAMENPGRQVPSDLMKQFEKYAKDISGYPQGIRQLPKLNSKFSRYIRKGGGPEPVPTPPPAPKKQTIDSDNANPVKKQAFKSDFVKQFFQSTPVSTDTQSSQPTAPENKGFDVEGFFNNATKNDDFNIEDFFNTSVCNDENLNDPTGVSLEKAHAKLKGKIFAGIEVPDEGFIDFIDYKNVKDLKTDAEMDIAAVAKKHKIDTKDISLSDAFLTMRYKYKNKDYDIIQGTGGELEVLLCLPADDDQAWTAGAPEDSQGDGSKPSYNLSTSGAGSAESSKRNQFYRLAQQVTKVGDKFEAVKIIQRAMVDMGFLVHKKGAIGAMAISGIKGTDADDSWNPLARVYREYGAEQLDGMKNDSAQWPRDDEKWMIDGKPGIRTRTAVSVFQVFCLNLGFDLGNTGPKRDGVDGIVGEKTWAAMEQQAKKGNIKSLRPINSNDENDAGSDNTEPSTAEESPSPTAPVSKTQQVKKVSTAAQTPQSQGTQSDKPDPANAVYWYTGIDFFDRNFSLAARGGKILKMASGVGNVALETKPDNAFPDKSRLLYDAYLLYENLDGLDPFSQDEIASIISKYSLPIDKIIEDAREKLGIEDTAEAMANSEEWFKNIEMTGFGLFNSFSQAYFTGHAIYYAYNGRLALEKDTNSGGLIKWLIDDSMEEEAQMLRQRIKAERYVAAELNKLLIPSKQLPDDGGKTAREKLINIIKAAAKIQAKKITKPKSDSVRNRQQDPPGGFGTNFVIDRETGRLRPSRPGEG